jgi:hypothetical protein
VNLKGAQRNAGAPEFVRGTLRCKRSGRHESMAEIGVVSHYCVGGFAIDILTTFPILMTLQSLCTFCLVKAVIINIRKVSPLQQ